MHGFDPRPAHAVTFSAERPSGRQEPSGPIWAKEAWQELQGSLLWQRIIRGLR